MNIKKEQRNTPVRICAYHRLALLLALIFCNSAVSQSQQKTAYGILIDNTGSLRTQFSQAKALGKEAVERALPHGSISIFNFMTQKSKRGSLAVVTSSIEWSEDKSALENSIGRLWIVPGQTSLLDAVY